MVALHPKQPYYVHPSLPEWRNWYTHQTQNLASFTAHVGSSPTSGTINFLRKTSPEQLSKIKENRMVTVGLLVRLEAKPGKEAEVESFLKSGLALVQEEPETAEWFAIRMGQSTFGIFDAFPDESGRKAHLNGKVAAALMAKASDLLAQPPVIERVDVLATKLP